MYSPFHKLLIKSEGTIIKKPLLAYYFFLSYFYSVLASTLGSVNNLVNDGSVYNSVKFTDRVPALNVVFEVEELLKRHGFLKSKTCQEYNSLEKLHKLSPNLSKISNKNNKSKKSQLNTSEADTSFVTEETRFAEDDSSLSDLDEFVTLMENSQIDD